MNNQQKSLIINQAADAIVHYLHPELPLGEGATKEMAESALIRLVDQYENTRVSHIFWNTCYQRATYQSKAWSRYWDVENPEETLGCFQRLFHLLYKMGIEDVYALLIPRSRERGISPWVSLRMNDVHFSEDPNRMNPFWNEHPEYRLFERPGFDNGFDFTHVEVREHYMKLVRESFFRWDVDGVELDWMRFLNLFRPGQVESARESLNIFMREVRSIADEAAEHHGHELGIAVRVPAKPEFAFGLGLDVKTWLDEGLVNIVIPGSHWQPSFSDTPVGDWKAISKGAKIIPGTDLWMGGCPGGTVAATGMGPIRGFTASMMEQGADGIYLFNHFESVNIKLSRFTEESGIDSNATLHDLLKVAGDVELSTSGPRRHVLTFHAPVSPDSHECPSLPAEISPTKKATFQLHTGPAPLTGKAILRVGLSDNKGFSTAELASSINGVACPYLSDMPTPPETEPRRHGFHSYVGAFAPRMMEFNIPLYSLKSGYNTIEIRSEDTTQCIVWVEISIVP